VHCDGEGKLCALGIDTNYRDRALPDVEPLDIPLYGRNMFKRVKLSTFPNAKSSSLFLQSGLKEDQVENEEEEVSF
jgi:hypothetical protein